MFRLGFLIYLQIMTVFTKIQQLYLVEDEQVFLYRQALIIPTNDTKIIENDVSSIQLLKSNAKTLSKQLSSLNRNLTMPQDFIKIFTSLQFDDSAIDICFSKLGSIYCKYRIMNQLIDENLVIFESYQYTLLTENNMCEQLHNIQINKFIVQCKTSQGLMISMINDQSEIIDQLLIQPIYNQTQYSIFKGQYIIIYETLDSLCALFVITWSTDSSYLQLQQLILNGQDYMDSEIVNKINNVQFYQNNILIVYFSYIPLQINLLNFFISAPYILKIHDVEYFQFVELSQLNSEIRIYLDNNIDKIFEINNKEFRINPKFAKIDQARSINDNIIIQFPKQLYIVNNNLIYDVLQTESSQVIYLENLPYILLFQKQGELQIFQINSFPFYLKYQQSTYLLVFFCIDMIINEYATIYKVNLLLKNVTMILDNNSINITVQDHTHSQAIYHYNSQMLGYPNQVTHFVDKSSVISEIYHSELISSKITKNILILIQKNSKFIIKIIFNINQTFTISDEINNIYLKHQYRFNFDKSQIFISSYQSAFIVQEQQTLYCYSYINTEFKAFEINFEKKINYLVQRMDLLYVYFENCMIMIVEFVTFIFHEQYQSYQLNCTTLSQKSVFNMKIQPSQIDILRKNTYTQSLRFHKIVRLQLFVDQKRLIIFELVENTLLMKHYRYQEKNNYFQYLYTFPTYSYNIDQPLKYKTYYTMIAIFAHNEQKDQYILIYDLQNKALNSMISLIQVDEKCLIFNFLSTEQFIYVYKNELRIYFLGLVKILFKSNLFKQNLNSYFYSTEIMLRFDSKYVVNNNLITLNLTFLNCNQRLELLMNNSLNYFINNSTKILPLNNVFGKIISATYIKGDTYSNLTSFTLQDIQKCSLFKQKTCILENNNIIIDSFELRITLQFNLNQIINVFTLFKTQFSIFLYTIDEQFVLRELIYNLEGKLIDQDKIQSQLQLDWNSVNSIQAVGNFILLDSINEMETKQLFFIQNHNLQQFMINGQNLFYFISIRRIPNFYFITYSQVQNRRTLNFLFLSYQFDIIAQSNISLNKILSRDSTNQQLILSDSEFVYESNNFKFDIIVCQVNLNCFYIQFQFDLQFNFFESKILHIIRYESSQQLKNIEFASTKYIILSLEKEGIIKQIYNIDQQNKFIIDSHQQLELQDYMIEKYNDTYFTAFKISLNSEVKLFQLHNYYVPCLQACDDEQVNLLLKNQVNQLNLTYQIFISNENSIFSITNLLQQLIIIITEITLFLYLYKIQKKSKI